MEEFRVLNPCFICEQPFQFGPHVYDGRYVRQWDVMVCNRCESANWGGLIPESHPRLLAHLGRFGIKLELNSKNWIDVPKN
jgi:hypothetical protein